MSCVLVATGGTIASTSTEHGARSTQDGAALLSQAGLQGRTDVVDWATRGSFAMTTLDMLALAHRIQQVRADQPTPVVVTHGTDSMEETAFMAALVLGAAPVVFTGAQRTFDDPAPDGPHNLRAAVAMAHSPDVAELGPLVAFDDLGFQARGVRKVDTLRAPAFDAPGRGPVVRMWGALPGVISRGQTVRPLDGLGALADLPEQAPYVPVVPMLPGSDGAALRAVATQEPAAVVLQAMGAGNAAPGDVEVITAMAEAGTPVLVTSRVHAGPVRPIYAGAGVALTDAGALFCGDLSPWQARVLASACALLRPQNPLAPATGWLTAGTAESAEQDTDGGIQR